MNIVVSFFGGLDRLAGIQGNEVVNVPENITIKELIRKFNVSEKEARFFLVNNESRDLNYVLQDGDRVEIFPIMGGG